MKKTDKNTVLAILLIGLILVMTPSYLRWLNPPPPVSPEADNHFFGVDSVLTPKFRSFDSDAAIYDPVITTLPEEAELIDTVEEMIVSIETPLYSAGLSSRGGGSIISWVLKNYSGPDKNPAKLLSSYKGGNLGIRFVNVNRDTVDLSKINWTPSPENQSYISLDYGQSAEISFTFRLPNGFNIRKSFRFNGDGYDFSLDVDASALSGSTINNRYTLSWDTPLLSTEKYLVDEMQYARALALLGDDVEELDAVVNKVEREYYDGNVSWAATRTKYFTAAIIPETMPANRVMLKSIGKNTRDEELYKSFAVSLDIPISGQYAIGSHRFTIYIGPLSYDLLKSYGFELEKMMNFGWGFIRPISKAVLWSFTKLHAFIPNYGLVIILFSILVKILVYPLTHKSFVSMKKMQDLQPVIAELKEKYKDDQPTMQKKQMQLFKEKGVNPLGGCLPMLLQMPLLFALFTVFRSTIELRGAEFVWWITDLSSQDTLFTLPFALPFYGANVNFLPIFMGFTMYLQQKYSGQSTMNQQQKFMGYFMPIFLVLFFNTFPSGLNLYYSLFNIFSVIQTKYLSDGIFGKKKQAEDKTDN
ncbi:MAG: membrane protein insertase YidC [Candidatus Marinimicrobia bacterium]|nr:membrane protein insertase YidC [Candidatus Neomarinimicrobiota bacterium]